MESINLGNIKIPVIVPEKGVDYYTETEKSIIIDEIATKVNENIEPKELERQESENTRLTNENIRQENEIARQEQENVRNKAEEIRINNEMAREENESIRQGNEETRLQSEQTRQVTFDEQITKNEEAIAEIIDKTEQYNQNASEKLLEFNTNVEEQTNNFNDNAVAKINEYNENASELLTRVEETEIKIQTLETDNTTNKEDIANIKSEQETQNTSIKNIETKNTEQDTKLVKLQEENKKLRSQIPSGQAEGEYITLNDSSNLEFEEFGISGNSKQETREGYNKAKFNNSVNADRSNFIYANEQANNIKCTKNSTGGLFFARFELNAEEAGDYLLTLNCSKEITFYVYSDELWGTSVYSSKTSSGKAIISISTTGTYIIGLYISGDIGQEIEVKDFMIVYGNKEKPYEQYGAMPSLDYKSEVKSCGDNINLNDGINQNYYINSMATSCGVASGNSGKIIETNGSEYITISSKANQERLRAGCINESINDGKSYTLYKGINKDNQNSIILNCKGYKYIVVNATDLSSVKIAYGSVVTPYSPYGCGSANITICNKNLLDLKNNLMPSNGGLTYSYSNSKLSVTGTATTTWAYITDIINKKIPIGTYTFSIDTVLPQTIYLMVTYEDETFQNYLIQSGSKSITFTTTKVSKSVRIIFSAMTSGVEYNQTIGIQFEENTVATNYEQHQEQSFTIPVQQEMLEGNCFEKVDGVWKEKHNWDYALFIGADEESYSVVSTSTSGCYRFYTKNLGAKKVANASEKCSIYSNMLKAITRDNTYNMIEGITYTADGRIVFYLDKTKNMSTVEELKQFLKDNNLKIWFKLEETNYIDCTQEQIDILNEIDRIAHTYKNTTHIFSTDEISPVINVKYKKDLETILNNMQAQILAE